MKNENCLGREKKVIRKNGERGWEITELVGTGNKVERIKRETLSFIANLAWTIRKWR